MVRATEAGVYSRCAEKRVSPCGKRKTSTAIHLSVLSLLVLSLLSSNSSLIHIPIIIVENRKMIQDFSLFSSMSSITLRVAAISAIRSYTYNYIVYTCVKKDMAIERWRAIAIGMIDQRLILARLCRQEISQISVVNRFNAILRPRLCPVDDCLCIYSDASATPISMTLKISY